MEEESAVLGFPVVHASLRDIAVEKLRLGRYPPTQDVINRLVSSAPQDEKLSKEWFEALTTRISGEIKSIRREFRL